MNSTTFEGAIGLLARAQSPVLFSHVRPDGDAYGSVLALGLALRALGKKVRCFNQDGLTSLYTFLPGSEGVEPTPAASVDCDLVVSLDTSTPERLGKHLVGWNRPVDLNLDHHVSNTGYAGLNVVRPDLPATALLVQLLLEEAGWEITPEIAANLFVGLSTDTGSFRYRGTTAETLRAAARLVEAGADVAALSEQCYQSLSLPRFELKRKALESLVFELDHRLSLISLRPEDFTACGAKGEDTEGLVESALTAAPVEISAFFEYRPDGALKISLRSKGKYNVSALAGEFGGGGHPGAAGINFAGDAGANAAKVLERLRQVMAAS
jgi:phosphoesterase RecJ-like protein